MNLKNNQITLGELLDYPASRALLQKRFPMAMKHPTLGAARTVTLEQLMAFAGTYLPRSTINETLQELARV
ncbi:MAG: hypothetical protein RRY65_05465 [Pseudoflavonifractor sp.]